MKDLLMQDGKPESDLSKRMADNVVQTMVAYMRAPSSATAEAVHAYSTALSSLSLLAIAEQLQKLNEMLAPAMPPVACERCNGSGYLEVIDGWRPVCPDCQGDGVVKAN